jgi:cytochrome c556
MKAKIFRTTLLLSLGIGMTASAWADSDYPYKKEIEARQSFMQVYAYNLGLLGNMAKEKTPYDAKIATAAASNLVAAINMDNSTMWPKGSDADSSGLNKDLTRAKPDIWTTYPKVKEKSKDLKDALTKMAAVAGDGLGAVKANMKDVGSGCKGCHEAFRIPKDE